MFCSIAFFPSALRAQASDIAATAKELQSIKVVDDPTVDLPYDVPKTVQPLLVTFKREIRGLISMTLNGLGSAATPGELHDSLIRQLSQAGVHITPEGGVDTYGFIGNILVEQPARRSDLMVTVPTLQIPCGDDSSLYVFQRKSTHWELALSHEVDSYVQVDGALEDFQYSLFSVGPGQQWYVAEVWDTPWCTSVWRTVKYRALRPGISPGRPQILFAGEHGSNISYQPTVRASRNSFEVRFADLQGLDFGLWVRENIQAYDIAQNPPRRIAPLGLKPEDFLDEWVSLPWKEALPWIASDDPDDLRVWQERLRAIQGSADDISIKFVQPCGRDHTTSGWQVGISVNDGKGTEALPPEVYVSISSKGAQNYFVTAIGPSRPEGCPGETAPVRDDIDLSQN